MCVAKISINLHNLVLSINMLHKLSLVIMYMYDGHLKNIQHLYLYGKATEARLLEVEEDEECD